MGMFSKLAKTGVAKKAVDKAREPQNQRKIKSALSGLTGKGKGKSSGTKRT